MPKVESKTGIDIVIPEIPKTLGAVVLGKTLDVSIAQISDEELKKVGRAYTENLIKAANDLRNTARTSGASSVEATPAPKSPEKETGKHDNKKSGETGKGGK